VADAVREAAFDGMYDAAIQVGKGKGSRSLSSLMVGDGMGNRE
jgi:hypothetical protein